MSETPLDDLAATPERLGGGAAVERARLVDADLAGLRARGLRLADVEIARGNLSNSVAPELSLRRVVVSGARLTGAPAPGSPARSGPSAASRTSCSASA